MEADKERVIEQATLRRGGQHKRPNGMTPFQCRALVSAPRTILWQLVWATG